MSDSGDIRAALCSVLVPGIGQLTQLRYHKAATAFLCTLVLVAASLLLGRVSERAADVFVFMVLVPWWAFQTYDAYLGRAVNGYEWRRTFRIAWHRGYGPASCSLLLPGLGQLTQRRYVQAATAMLFTVALANISLMLGRVSGRAAEVFFFMLLALPWWAVQMYDAYLGSAATGSEWLRTFRTAWRQGHDIRFLGVLLLISAVNDTIIIFKNIDYLLPFYCNKFSGIPGFLTKAISPVLHVAVGYGFVRLRRWAFFIYLLYAAHGFTNGMVNLACFGPGRIRNTLLAAVVISTIYIVWRRGVLLKSHK